MKNNPIDLNDHLFTIMERLNNKDLKGETLQEEIKRSAALNSTAANIIKNNAQTLKLVQATANNLADIQLPPMLELTVQKAKKLLEQ